MEKQTSVQWLEQMVNQNLSAPLSTKFQELFNQAKEMEKQQIVDAYADGRISVVNREIISCEQYYNQTYK